MKMLQTSGQMRPVLMVVSMNESLKNHYDAKYAAASKHEIETVLPVKYPTDRLTACVSFLPDIQGGGKILELASGNGFLAASLVESGLEFDEYVASEMPGSRLDALHRKLDYPKVRVEQIDAEQLTTLESDTYDAVIMVALIEHLIDPLSAMQQVARILKPGGIVYIDTPNIAKYTRRIKLMFGRFPATSSRDEGLTTYSGDPVDLHDEGHLHYFTYGSLTRMLQTRCGFGSVEAYPYPMGKIGFGRYLDSLLAKIWPSLFAEITITAKMPVGDS